MPTQGVSLHIGLNSVDPAHYQGWDGTLAGCEFDANDLEAIAKKQGFTTSKLLTRQATSASVIAGITAAAGALKPGDIFLLTYSGHGGQLPDTNHDEKDRQDETWVLFDRQLVDDELYQLWGKFKAGVRIFVLSDSCHSGTVLRAMPPGLGGPAPLPAAPRIRLLPPNVGLKTYRANKAAYDQIQKATTGSETAKLRATAILISGCQDNQTSADGDRNGLFTENLLRVWAKGKFTGTHKNFRDKIAARMPAVQTPNYYKVGAANAAFEAQKPFTI